MKEKISLAGDLGSGKSTVSSLLVERIGADYYCTGAKVRSIAERLGMSVVELNVYMETHPEIDQEIDDGLRALALEDKHIIIDSRLAWHFTPGTFKVYLSTDIETSALRIMTANRRGEHAASLEATIADTRSRRASEKKRYAEQYGVDIMNLLNYDLVVDTSDATPSEVADCIIAAFEEWKRDKSYSALFITPTRLMYPADAPDAELIDKYSAMLELGQTVPKIQVTEDDGDFYLTSGLEAALAYSFNGAAFIPATLVSREHTGEYIRMKNSL